MFYDRMNFFLQVNAQNTRNNLECLTLNKNRHGIQTHHATLELLF